MSNVQAVQTLKPAIRKAFAPVHAPAFIAGLVSLPDDEMVKPSSIRMNKGTAAASMGGQASPQAFLTGLAFFVSAYAYGQGKLDALQQGLPAHAQFALVAACKPLKFGAGITAGMLRHAVILGFDAMLALPAPEKKAPAIIKAPEQASQPAPEQASQPAPHWSDFEGPISRQADGMRIASIHESRMDSAIAAAAAAAAATVAPRPTGPAFVELFAKLAESQPEQARTMLEEMAQHLGLVVRKAPVKRAA